MFLSGSLWVLVGGGVACLEEASGTGRPFDSRYVLILDLMEVVKETPCDRGPDERTERGKHTKRCQSNSEFEEMALLMNLLSPEAKEGRAALGKRWIKWLTDLRD